MFTVLCSKPRSLSRCCTSWTFLVSFVSLTAPPDIELVTHFVTILTFVNLHKIKFQRGKTGDHWAEYWDILIYWFTSTSDSSDLMKCWMIEYFIWIPLLIETYGSIPHANGKKSKQNSVPFDIWLLFLRSRANWDIWWSICLLSDQHFLTTS